MSPTSRRALLATAAAALLLLAGIGCGRWMDYAPVRLQGQVHDPDVVFRRLMQRATTLGYTPASIDPARRYFSVRAHLDQRRRPSRRISFFHVAVRRGGAVDVSVNGYHLRHGAKIHRKLCAELTVFLDTLSAEIGATPRVIMVGAR